MDSQAGESLAGVTVSATSPALQGTASAYTDDDGGYLITNLPPGVYEITFELGDARQRTTGIQVYVGKTVVVNGEIDLTGGAAAAEVVVVGRTPQIDVSGAKQSTTLTEDYHENVPTGRTYADTLSIAPGAVPDLRGTSFGGSTSIENNYVVDGMNTTGVQYGSLQTPLMNNFVEEIEIITSGFDVSYGRSSGGVVNVVTKSGTNELHGSAWVNYTPFSADADDIRGEGNAIWWNQQLDYEADFGFDIGGPLVCDKVWFYAGFSPRYRGENWRRSVGTQVDREFNANDYTITADADDDPATSNAVGCELDGTCESDGIPDLDENGLTRYELLDTRTVDTGLSEYQAVGKLNFAAAPEHQGSLSTIIIPSSSEGPYPQAGEVPNLYGTPSGTEAASDQMTLSVIANWTSKFMDGKTQVDATAGYQRWSYEFGHRYDETESGMNPEQLPSVLLGPDYNLGVAGRNPDTRESAAALAACTDDGLFGEEDPFPGITNCPLGAGYRYYAPWNVQDLVESRLAGRTSITQRVELGGTHQFKVGGDLELNGLDRSFDYSNSTRADEFGGVWAIVRFITPGEGDDVCGYEMDGSPIPCTMGPAVSNNQSFNWSLYAQDTYQPIPNLTLQAGVRYEQQKVYVADEVKGTVEPISGVPYPDVPIDLKNFAPRVGAVYDWTGEGRSKVFANWARYYQTVPLDIAAALFGGNALWVGIYIPPDCGDPLLEDGDTVLHSSPENCPRPTADGSQGPTAANLTFNSLGAVAPGLKAQHTDEFLTGVEYAVTPDLTFSLSYVNRVTPRTLEDISGDGGATLTVANPGTFDEDEEQRLMDQIAAEDDPARKAYLERILSASQGSRRYPDPRREYNAITLVAKHRLADNLFAQGSYQWSRLEGNYEGLFTTDSGQVAPNHNAIFDVPELLVNADGLLPQDRTHQVKLDGYYVFDMEDAGQVVGGLRFRGYSGIPVSALGAHPFGGPNLQYLQERGGVERTDFVTATDVHVGYGRMLGENYRLELYFDVFNVFNQQTELRVDQAYTYDPVNPVVNGDEEDLLHAKLVDGSTDMPVSPTRNRNFGRPISLTAPLSARFGVALRF